MVHRKNKSELPPMKIKTTRKEGNKKEDNIKQNIKKSYQHWNDYKLQIHWNKLEWVVPKIRYVKKTPFYTSSHKFYSKYKNPKTIGLGIH